VSVEGEGARTACEVATSWIAAMIAERIPAGGRRTGAAKANSAPALMMYDTSAAPEAQPARCSSNSAQLSAASWRWSRCNPDGSRPRFPISRIRSRRHYDLIALHPPRQGTK
jgi:hypothetical protein